MRLVAIASTDLDCERRRDWRGMSALDAAGLSHGFDMVGKRNQGWLPSSEKQRETSPCLG